MSLESINHNLFFLSNKHDKLNSKFLTLKYDLDRMVYVSKEKRIEYYSMKTDLNQLKNHIKSLNDKKKVIENIKALKDKKEVIRKNSQTIISII